MSARIIIVPTGKTGPSGGAGSTALDDLTDVTITTPSNGQVLKYNGSAWVNGTDATGGGGGTLDDLTDVTITAAASGDILRHNGTAWVDAVGTTHFDAAGSAAAAQAASQPLDSDLTAIAALSTTAYGRAFLTLANQAATMALLSAASDTASGIVELATNAETATGTDTTRAVTPANVASVLASYLTTSAAAAGYQPLDSDLTAIAALTTTAYGRAFLSLANQAALMALLSAASDTASGIVELATTAETTTGTDTGRAVTPAGLLNATTASNINARIGVEKAGVLVGTRRNINFIEGSNVTLTVTDDAGSEEVDVTITASGGGGSYPAGEVAFGSAYPIVASTWHAMRVAGAGVASTDGQVSLMPFVVHSSCTVTGIGIRTSTAVASSSVKIGLYDSTSSGYPGTLLASDSLDTTTTSGSKTAVVSVTLAAGAYWLAILPTSGGSGVPSIFGVSSTNVSLGTFGPAQVSADNLPRGLSPIFTATVPGTLDATAPALTWSTSANVGQFNAFIQIGSIT